jgi:hypothetical protein
VFVLALPGDPLVQPGGHGPGASQGYDRTGRNRAGAT